MKSLRVIEVKGQRVLTTKQLAEAYETDAGTIQYNFRYNKKRYILGKHYVELAGDELRALKTTSEFPSSLKYAKSLYLWTEKGALLHAKSLNTDKAWEVYENLVDFYFRAKEGSKAAAGTELRAAQRAFLSIPEDAEIQKHLTELKKQLGALEAVSAIYNQFSNEEQLKGTLEVMESIASNIVMTVFRLKRVRPKLVSKMV